MKFVANVETYNCVIQIADIAPKLVSNALSHDK